MALIFAGGVIVSAALIASALGSGYTPQVDDGAVEDADSSALANATDANNSSASLSGVDSDSDADDGWVTDDDLVVDTKGFDPSPIRSDSSPAQSREPDDDPAGPPSARAAIQPLDPIDRTGMEFVPASELAREEREARTSSVQRDERNDYDPDDGDLEY